MALGVGKGKRMGREFLHYLGEKLKEGEENAYHRNREDMRIMYWDTGNAINILFSTL
jgi:uncharacterized protein YfeS